MSSRASDTGGEETQSQLSDEWPDMMTGYVKLHNYRTCLFITDPPDRVSFRALGKIDVFLSSKGLRSRAYGANRSCSLPTSRKTSRSAHVKSPLTSTPQSPASHVSSPRLPRTPVS